MTTPVKHQPPYWRLSSFYFFYFAVLGILVPYWNVYLKELGFSAIHIGYLSAILLGTKVIAPYLWGIISDKTNRRLQIIRLGSFFAFLFFIAIFYSQTFLWFAFVTFTYSFFWNAVLPQYEVITLNHLEGEQHRYSLIRLWGSVGFVVAVVLLGYLLDYISVLSLPWFVAGFLLLIWLSSLFVSEKIVTPSVDEKIEGLRSILKRKRVMGFIAVSFLMLASHGPYYTFFSIYLENYGFSRTVTGQLWGLGVLAEVVLCLFMHRIMLKFSIESLLLFSLVLAVIRWLFIAFFVDSLILLLFAQILHAATFGMFHSAAIEFVRQNFKGHEGQGQALYSSVSFGAGGAFGAFISGVFWDISPTACFVFASACALGGVIICSVIVKPTGKANHTEGNWHG